MTKKLAEEHDQRRIEQMEVVSSLSLSPSSLSSTSLPTSLKVTQRLENTEKGSKNDITELFSRIKRYEEEARIDNDEVNLNFQQKQNISFFL